jgi:hypothetical protein
MAAVLIEAPAIDCPAMAAHDAAVTVGEEALSSLPPHPLSATAIAPSAAPLSPK